MIFAISMATKPHMIEVILAMPLAVAVAVTAPLPFLRRMETANRRTAFLIFAGALFLPSILLVRFVVLPEWKSIGPSLDALTAGLPTVSFLIFLTGGTFWMMARAASWNMQTRWLRRGGSAAFVVAWTPIWIQALEMSHGHLAVGIILAPAGAIGALAWIDHIVSPRVEDEYLFAKSD